MEYGYVRCSSQKQNEARQIEALHKYGLSDDQIVIDKESGKIDTDERTRYSTLRKLLRAGDVLVIDAVDRIGRTKVNIKDEIEYLKKKGVRLVILSLPTTMIQVEQNQAWVVDMVTNLLIEVYSSIAEQELVEKERRTRAGIEVAKAAGKYKGRKPIEYDHEKLVSLYPRWKAGSIKTHEMLELLHLKKNTFYRAVEKYERAH